ncbi:hypothetical protein J2W96_006257 [Variovorax guangxiensis]|nr:hypothetical protein [Variovorax guangxiensis]MDR6859917.1 hypothetical protein [Variovorax guangxiensis]
MQKLLRDILWNHGDADAARHHAAHRFKVVRLHAQAHFPSEAVGLVLQKNLRGAGARQTHHILVKDLGK